MPIEGERRVYEREALQDAPETPGVYALFESEETTFYGSAFGGTITIRSCLLERFSGIGRDATHCAWEISLNPEARQRQLLEEHRGRHGALPRWNEKPG